MGGRVGEGQNLRAPISGRLEEAAEFMKKTKWPERKNNSYNQRAAITRANS